MTSLSGATLDLPAGVQPPRHLWVPDYVSSSGQEAIELAALAGLDLDLWQQFVVINMLGERDDGRWAAFEVGLEVARQNGKGGVYEARELAGLFLLGERLLIHSAHEYKTAEQALDRMEALITNTPSLHKRLKAKGVKRSHGQEGIYLKSGQVLRYFTRTASSGRGFSCDFLGLDEAMKIKHSMHAAMFPTMAARPNAQIMYAGSAVDQDTMEDGIVFASVRERGIKGGDPRLMYVGYGAPFDHPDDVTDEAACDPANWAAANPALGIRITPEYIEIEQRALSARGFAVERLGVGDWPRTDGTEGRAIMPADWAAIADPDSIVRDPVCIAFDVSPDRATASIASAGLRSDGRSHVEIIEHCRGTDWIVDMLVGIKKRQRPLAFVTDASGPAASLLPELVARKIEVHLVNSKEHAQACGMIYDGVDQGTLRHLGTSELSAAIAGAVKRPLGDAWGWSRINSTVDISPLVAVTLALWGSTSKRKKRRTRVVSLGEALEAAERAEREKREAAARETP